MGIKTVGHTLSANAKDCGTLQSLGDISQKRAVKEYDPINADDVIQAIGKSKTDPISMSVIYDPADANGAGELETAYNGGTTIPIAIELSNLPAGDGVATGLNGTIFSWTGAVINEFKLTPDADGFMLASFTATFNGSPTVTAAI